MISTIISTTLLQTLIPYKKTDIESKTGFEDNVHVYICRPAGVIERQSATDWKNDKFRKKWTAN